MPFTSVLCLCCMCRFISFFSPLFRVHKNLLLLNNHSLTTLHVGQWFAQITHTHTTHGLIAPIETVRQTVHMFWWSRSGHFYFSRSIAVRRFRGVDAVIYLLENVVFITRKDIKIFRWKIVRLNIKSNALIEIYLRQRAKKKTEKSILCWRMPQAYRAWLPWCVDAPHARCSCAVWSQSGLCTTNYIIKMLIIIVIWR